MLMLAVVVAPATSSLYPGADVPIPRFPPEVSLILSEFGGLSNVIGVPLDVLNINLFPETVPS